MLQYGEELGVFVRFGFFECRFPRARRVFVTSYCAINAVYVVLHVVDAVENVSVRLYGGDGGVSLRFADDGFRGGEILKDAHFLLEMLDGYCVLSRVLLIDASQLVPPLLVGQPNSSLPGVFEPAVLFVRRQRRLRGVMASSAVRANLKDIPHLLKI